MKKNHRVKGFTLMELIVVIAIIGILAAILAPTMSNYYKSSRIKDENSNARMVYNAAQTEMQRYVAMDRTASTASPFSGTLIVAYYEDGRILTSLNGLDSVLQQPSAADAAVYEQFVNEVNQTVSDAETTNWAVCIENYIVKGCMSADSLSTNYVGRYSAKDSSSQKSEASGPAAKTYSQLMASGTELADFTEQYYGLDNYDTPAPTPTT